MWLPPTWSEYFALGFRNPYRFSQDPVTGRIWVGDVGQDTREEVDTLLPGRNYQWAYMEGIVAGPKAKPSSVIGIAEGPVVGFIRMPKWRRLRHRRLCLSRN